MLACVLGYINNSMTLIILKINNTSETEYWLKLGREGLKNELNS